MVIQINVSCFSSRRNKKKWTGVSACPSEFDIAQLAAAARSPGFAGVSFARRLRPID
jgi:hypothetical protein